MSLHRFLSYLILDLLYPNILRQEPSESVANLLAELNIPLADVFAFANFALGFESYHSILTSVPEAMSLQMPSNLRRYFVDNIN